MIPRRRLLLSLLPLVTLGLLAAVQLYGSSTFHERMREDRAMLRDRFAQHGVSAEAVNDLDTLQIQVTHNVDSYVGSVAWMLAVATSMLAIVAIGAARDRDRGSADPAS